MYKPLILQIGLGLLILSLGATQAIASENEAYCALVREQARVKTTLLSNAEFYVTEGPQGIVPTLNAGVRKSLSDWRKAGLVADVAEADCNSYTLEHQILNTLNDFDAQVEKQALSVRIPLLQTAYALASKNVKQEQILLKQQLSTWTDVRTALDQQDKISEDIAQSKQSEARLGAVPAITTSLTQSDLDSNSKAQEHLANLQQNLIASNSWDLSVELGSVRNLQTDTSMPSVSVTYSLNFGRGASLSAAEHSASLAVDYLKQERTGATQQLINKQKELTELYFQYQTTLSNLAQRQELINQTREQMLEVPTALGQRMGRNLMVEQLMVQAELAAVTVRSDMTRTWLEHQGLSTK